MPHCSSVISSLSGLASWPLVVTALLKFLTLSALAVLTSDETLVSITWLRCYLEFHQVRQSSVRGHLSIAEGVEESLTTCFFFIYLSAFYWAGFTVAQRERAQKDFNVPYKGAPPHPPHICIRKTATAPGSPYTFRIVRGFFYVPKNYQHSRNCETGPPAYRPYPKRLESLTICR